MHRVITRYKYGLNGWVEEAGPWHPLLSTAESWAETLREHGYVVSIESQNDGSPKNEDVDLMAALQSMA